MESMELIHLYPTLEVVAEELNRAGMACRTERGAGEPLRLRKGQILSKTGEKARQGLDFIKLMR